MFRKNRNGKILPSSGQSSASDKNQPTYGHNINHNTSTTAAGVVLTGVSNYASSYTRKTGMDSRDPIFTLDVRTGNSRQVLKIYYVFCHLDYLLTINSNIK